MSMNRIVNSATGVIVAIIASIILLIVGVSLGPTVITYFGWVNATSMENVTMGNILVLFANYAPFFYYLAVVGGSIAAVVGAVAYIGRKR